MADIKEPKPVKISPPNPNWYRDDIAYDRAAEARWSIRSRQIGGTRADADAITYAEWLIARDKVDLVSLGAAVKRAVIELAALTAPKPTKAQAARMKPLRDLRPPVPSTFTLDDLHVRVIWEGKKVLSARPRYVVWSYSGSKDHEVYRLELPHWDYVAPTADGWLGSAVAHTEERIAA